MIYRNLGEKDHATTSIAGRFLQCRPDQGQGSRSEVQHSSEMTTFVQRTGKKPGSLACLMRDTCVDTTVVVRETLPFHDGRELSLASSLSAGVIREDTTNNVSFDLRQLSSFIVLMAL